MQTFGPVDTFGNTYVPQFTDYQLDEEALKTALSRRDTQLAIALNYKANGVFETVETQTGEQFFGSTTNQQKKRYSFRKVFSFGAIAAPGTLAIAHGITGITQCTHIYGTCITAIPDFRPIPHASVTANANIEVIVSATTITINNGAGGPAITSGLIVLEYLKQ
jgi:hypothetical protein